MDPGLKFTRITFENYSDYNELISTYALEGLDRDKTFGIGVIDGDILPVAALLFSYEDNNDAVADGAIDADTALTAVLDWIYVRDEYRGMEIARSLFDLFVDTVREVGAKTIKSQLRAPFSDAESLKEFLAKCEFKVKSDIAKDILLSWDYLHDVRIMLKPKRISGVKKLADLGNIGIRDLEQRIKKTCKMPVNFTLLDKNLSLACYEAGDVISGVLLVDSDRFGNIKPVLLRSFGKDGAQTIYKLLYAGIDSLLQERFEGVSVKIDMTKVKTAELVTNIFPSLPSRETLLYTLEI